MKVGANQITVRIQNARNDGGFAARRADTEARQQDGDCWSLEISHRAPDQRRHTLLEAG
jgi:hypothetical protein